MLALTSAGGPSMYWNLRAIVGVIWMLAIVGCGHDAAQHTNERKAPVAALWTRVLADAPSTMVSDGDSIFLCDGSTLTAYSSTGATMWSAGGQYGDSAVFGSSVVAYETGRNRFAAFDRQTGRPLWTSRALPSLAEGTPIIFGNGAAVALDDRATIVDLSNGTLRHVQWPFQHFHGPATFIHPNVLVFALTDTTGMIANEIAAVSFPSFKMLWTADDSPDMWPGTNRVVVMEKKTSESGGPAVNLRVVRAIDGRTVSAASLNPTSSSSNVAYPRDPLSAQAVARNWSWPVSISWPYAAVEALGKVYSYNLKDAAGRPAGVVPASSPVGFTASGALLAIDGRQVFLWLPTAKGYVYEPLGTTSQSVSAKTLASTADGLDLIAAGRRTLVVDEKRREAVDVTSSCPYAEVAAAVRLSSIAVACRTSGGYRLVEYART